MSKHCSDTRQRHSKRYRFKHSQLMAEVERGLIHRGIITIEPSWEGDKSLSKRERSRAFRQNGGE